MTRDLTSTNTKNLPPMYKLLAEFIANETSPKLHEYIFQLHSNSTSKLTKQAKIVPEIVYQVSWLYFLATKNVHEDTFNCTDGAVGCCFAKTDELHSGQAIGPPAHRPLLGQRLQARRWTDAPSRRGSCGSCQACANFNKR
jgi:hypothetical protein